MTQSQPIAASRSSYFSYFGFILLCFLSAVSYADKVSSSSNNIHIRSLAASCAACHGTNGNSRSITPVLAGLDAGYFTTQMHAFKKGSRESTVMHHHATGINDEEISLLAEYFSQQKRATPPPLKPQTLREKP